ncbi:MAG TPA: sulfatase-like hydrolase/transferase [Candidatus Heimdallarchaeota archaeon]|nr:sulfatase-like hydrolase/transferase [Candidatus Heimdallarchaeota archaeon]
MRKKIRSISCLSIACFILLGLFAVSIKVSGEAETEPGQNFLLITIDTLRADRLSCYDRTHVQTPNIDSLAQKGVLFSKAFANTPTTLPSHASILLGITPLHHGVHDNYNFIVLEEFLTLAEHLKNFGYSTGAIIGAHPLDSRFGLNQGFDAYDDEYDKLSSQKFAHGERWADDITKKAIEWLEDQDTPWFLWTHFYDPHEPYEPPEPFKTKYKARLYDGEVAFVDSELGKLLDYMKTKNLFKNTLIVLTSDHGESLEEHGEKTHGYFAYNSTIWVPLIFTAPNGGQKVVEQHVSHVDIFPTACDILKIPKPPFLQGISLMPALNGKNLPERLLYFESLYPFYSRGWAPLQGYISHKEKFIQSPIPELYNLEQDFQETNNIAVASHLGSHRKNLDVILQDQPRPEEKSLRKKVDRESLEKLRSLGYISEPYVSKKKTYGTQDDIKTLLPYHRRAENALSLHNSGNVDAGIQILKEILTERNDIDVAYIYLAGIYDATGKPAEALEVLQLGLKNLPSSYRILTPYVELLLKEGHNIEVIKIISAKNLLPMEHDSEIYIALAQAYGKEGDLDGAIAAYEKALTIDNEYTHIYTSLGEVYLSRYLKTKDRMSYSQSIDNFKTALELDPASAPAYSGLGDAYGQAGDLKGAISSWEKALELNPEQYLLNFNLGLAHFNSGNKTKALEYFNRLKESYYSQLPHQQKQALDDLIQRCKQEDLEN